MIFLDNIENSKYNYPVEHISIEHMLDIIKNIQHKDNISANEIYFLENYEIYLAASIVGQLGNHHANRLGRILIATTE